jgi:lysophospholipase L1-like esterase
MFSCNLRGNLFRAATSFVASAVFLFAPAGPPASAAEAAWIAKADPIRIMALGDSITAGVGARGADIGGGGYRGELEALLDAAGYHYEMIGSRSDFSGNVRFRGHEGWPGYVIRSLPSDPGKELLGSVTREAIDKYDPDIVLLMAGTNDLLRLERHSPGYTVGNIVSSMDALLAQIFADKPRVHVVLAGVVDSPIISDCAVKEFDGVDSLGCDGGDGPNLKTLVDSYSRLGYSITLASRMDAAVPRDREHFPDGIHPCGAGGYAAIARVWMRAIEQQTVGYPRGSLAVADP